MPTVILRRKKVEHLTGLPTSSLYEKIAQNKFPAPIPLGPKAVGWLEEEVVAWQEARIAERHTATSATSSPVSDPTAEMAAISSSEGESHD